MFNTIEDIWRDIKEFEFKNRIKPNVIFISRKNKAHFFQLINSDYYYYCNSSNPQDFNRFTLFGLLVRFTESLDEVDYIAEFDKSSFQNFYLEYFNCPPPEYIAKMVPEKPRLLPEKTKQKKKRRIIL
jgi:hypothetical protein